MSYTPGPWQTHGDCECGEVYGPDGNVGIHRATTFEGFDVVPNKEQQIANSRLVAAAPELREAVERLLYVMTPECNDPFAWNGAIDAGEAALAKARGEESQ